MTGSKFKIYLTIFAFLCLPICTLAQDNNTLDNQKEAKIEIAKEDI